MRDFVDRFGHSYLLLTKAACWMELALVFVGPFHHLPIPTTSFRLVHVFAHFQFSWFRSWVLKCHFRLSAAQCFLKYWVASSCIFNSIFGRLCIFLSIYYTPQSSLLSSHSRLVSPVEKGNLLRKETCYCLFIVFYEDLL